MTHSRELYVCLALVFLVVELPGAQTPLGTWEGEIQDPERPVVGMIDFDAGKASFSGGPALPITKRDISEAQVTFEVTDCWSACRARWPSAGTRTRVFTSSATGRR